MEVTDEREAYREQLRELSVEALDLAGARCELALKMGALFKEQQALGAEMEKLGAKEIQIHLKRRQLASLLLTAPLDDPNIG